MCLLVLLWLKYNFKILTCVQTLSWTNLSTRRPAYELKKIKFKQYSDYRNALMRMLFVILLIKFMFNSEVCFISKRYSNLCRRCLFRKRISCSITLKTSHWPNIRTYFQIKFRFMICLISICFNISCLLRLRIVNKPSQNKYSIQNNNIRCGILSITLNTWNSYTKWTFYVASLNDNKFQKNKFKNTLMTLSNSYPNHWICL